MKKQDNSLRLKALINIMKIKLRIYGAYCRNMPTDIFFRNVMCIGGILEPGRITRELSIIAVNQLTPNNLKMTYR
ncbi:hypothetical protein DXZ79_01865 [Yersinia rochesterensis]|uniref:Uncharacterized protein n=1 Tax=Yersinia rochesterensis TaxID=1604335 RepID=A0A8D4MZ15_9GAMM|nr:hypothetical protein DXZ79_01865 [Yersinia rochesterensis]